MANTVIALKKSATPSAAPADLANGELAINYADGKLFYKNTSGQIAQISGAASGSSFGTVNAAGTLLIADTVNDILDIRSGDNIIITGDAINDKMTINADLTAANSWANTKLSNGTVTLAGALTTTGQIYVNQQITIYPLGTGEGGQIDIWGADSYPDWSIDSYNDSLRFFTLNSGTQLVTFFNAGAGNIKTGINRGDPGYALDVVGTINATSILVNGSPVGGTSDLTPANNWANTISTAVGTAGNNYTVAVGAAGNAYALATATSIGTAGNNYSIGIGASANNWANTKLANTSGITFAGDLNVSGNLSSEGTTFFVNAITNNTGFGRTDPGYTVDVVGTVNAQALLVNGAPLTAGGGVTVSDDNNVNSIYYPLISPANTGTLSTANVSSAKFYFVPNTGTLSATSFNSLSDIKYKDNVINLYDSQDIINRINPVSFNWKDTGKKSYGVIAQDLEKVLPELVETNEKGIKSVSYIPMIAMLIDVVQKQQKEIEEIKKQLNKENK